MPFPVVHQPSGHPAFQGNMPSMVHNLVAYSGQPVAPGPVMSGYWPAQGQTIQIIQHTGNVQSMAPVIPANRSSITISNQRPTPSSSGAYVGQDFSPSVVRIGQDSSVLTRTSGHPSSVFKVGELVSIKFSDGQRRVCQVTRTGVNFAGNDGIEYRDEHGAIRMVNADDVGKIESEPPVKAASTQALSQQKTMRVPNQAAVKPPNPPPSDGTTQQQPGSAPAATKTTTTSPSQTQSAMIEELQRRNEEYEAQIAKLADKMKQAIGRLKEAQDDRAMLQAAQAHAVGLGEELAGLRRDNALLLHDNAALRDDNAALRARLAALAPPAFPPSSDYRGGPPDWTSAPLPALSAPPAPAARVNGSAADGRRHEPPGGVLHAATAPQAATVGGGMAADWDAGGAGAGNGWGVSKAGSSSFGGMC